MLKLKKLTEFNFRSMIKSQLVQPLLTEKDIKAQRAVEFISRQCNKPLQPCILELNLNKLFVWLSLVTSHWPVFYISLCLVY